MPKKFVIQHKLPDIALNRFHYIVNFINAHPLKPVDLLLVIDNGTVDNDLFYGNNSGSFFTVPIDACFLEETTAFTHFYPTPFSHSNAPDFFAVSNQKIKGGRFFQSNHFGFDIFNTLFFYISRYEEYFAFPSQNGQAGWLAEDQHFLVKNNLHEFPVVDQLLAAFFEIISNKKIEQKSTYSISHDVDILTRFTPNYKFFRSLAATIIKRKSWSQFWNSLNYYKKMILQKEKDPYDYFDILLQRGNEWEGKHIFMMTGGETTYDNKYKIDDPRAKELIQTAIDRGYSIGLHSSYNAGFKAGCFKEEKERLESVIGQTIVNNRQHWLRWSWKITPYLLESNAITSDSTMAYSQHLGFRCGTGFPYKMYDFKNNKAFSWTEYPMTMMESSAIHQARKTGEDLTYLIKIFILKNKKNTHLMLNFHNSNFDPLLNTGQALRYFYEKELYALCY